jgi:hypothetical protein
MAYIIKTSGEVKKIQPKNGTDFQLDELKSIVNGYIEVVYLPNSRMMIVNEEGKLNGLPLNEKATGLLWMLGGLDYIVGDVLLCDQDQVK